MPIKNNRKTNTNITPPVSDFELIFTMLGGTFIDATSKEDRQVMDKNKKRLKDKNANIKRLPS